MHELRHLFALLVGSNKKYVDPSKAVDILKEAFSSPTGASDSQQDVSEFQHKLLEWLEDAFKKDNSDPSSPQEAKAGCSQQEDKKDDNPVVDLFYGQFQAEGYHEGKGFTNEETFGQFPLQVNGFRDIHESLEGATAQGEIEAVSSDVTQKSGQELWFSRLPPVLTFELSRFQFNQQMGRPEKIHNKIEFPKVIYMDRYMERNKALTRQRREEARKLKEELTVLHAKLDKFICYGSGSKRFPLQDVLSSVLQFAESKPSTPSQQSHDVEMESPKPNSVTNCRTESPSSLPVPSVDVTMSSPLPRSPGRPPKPPPDVPSPSPRHVSESELQVLQDCLRRWRTEVETDVRELQENISRLEDQVNSTYSDDAMQKFPYHLHAVLVHEGQAASGHYWAYIYDLTREKWLKFNDITVSESSWEELEKESMGGYHNASAYCLMYVDRTRLEALEGRQRKEQVEALPPDLSDQVMDDNKKFGKELEDWDREMALKKVGGDAEVTDHRRRGDKPAQTTGTQTVHMSQRINLSIVHAQLAMQDTMGIVMKMMEMSAAKPPGELLQSIIVGELRSLAKLEKQFPKKPLDDLRLRMVSLYLFMNGTDEDTQKWVLLEQITYLNRLDPEQRTKSLSAAAQEMMTTIQREKGEQGLRLHEAWHRKYHQFREVVYLFVKGLEAYYKERFAEAMPYFNIAWHYNTEVIEGKSENLGMSKQLVAFYQRECLEKLNAWSAQMFEAEDDISEMLTTMMDLVLPSMPALFLSGFSDDTASAEEMRERWCSFLGQDLDEYKVEKLQEILSKLFEPASETRSVRTPSVRITDMNELYYQYKSIMATADNQGDLDLVLKVT
ncbi:LOW QUALITY PROTEIN: ubiquitin carboxyl-terminal hydrolase 25-like [Haliotis cracherodii]|uniref:LOW QUALITY PROTEIN: ubiquitin carboxyl-terminal hydrolase 25-like n=1 Tax=Haliotis cracherodii TaxID=6455 RepID=UPI0039EA095E